MGENGFPNQEQQKIIAATDGPLLVLAPAGTGKTRVMAERIGKAIEAGVAPDRILSVTFTNRAATEMRSRVQEQLPLAAKNLHVLTFHGLCAWILRRDAQALGMPRDFVIYDDQDSIEIIKQPLKNLPRGPGETKPTGFYYALSSRKSHATGPELSLQRIPPIFSRPGEEGDREIADYYHRVLAERQAQDFSDLIYRVRALFTHIPEIRQNWAERFDWVQVDEVQDTHFSEYEVISTLAQRSRNLALFGDVDQTIYQWRGSNPAEVLGLFAKDFAPIENFSLSLNYRATRSLLTSADNFAATFVDRKTSLKPAPGLPAGDPVEVRIAPTAQAEANWIAQQAADIWQHKPDERIGILARTHFRLAVISNALKKAKVNHVTVEQFEFFRRQEIKDAIARLRIIANPNDFGALRRLLERPAAGIGRETSQKLYRLGIPAGLRMTDMVRLTTHAQGEPFASLLAARQTGTVVVFDVETTGLSPTNDEIIEIAAQRLSAGGEITKFHRLLRPTRPVGDSQGIHGWSDDYLAKYGENPQTVLPEFIAFAGDAHIIGHNVRFDLAMVRHQGRRLGLEPWNPPYDDTLDLARRLINDADRYDLGSLSRHLNLPATPTHKADDDVETTVQLLHALEPKLREQAKVRLDLVAQHGQPFRRIAEWIAEWQMAAEDLRPPELLDLVLQQSGLTDLYKNDPRRTRHLTELRNFFARHDNQDHRPAAALAELTQYAALAKNVDHLDESDRRIPVVTIHQAKGLEFDTVFIAGLTEDEFPSFLAIRDNKIEEEKHLFYVALTRAKRNLLLSGHQEDDRGREKDPSRFLPDLD